MLRENCCNVALDVEPVSVDRKLERALERYVSTVIRTVGARRTSDAFVFQSAIER